MVQYQVGFYFNGSDVADTKIFNDYEQAFDAYIDRVKIEFHKLGSLPTSLAIGYIEDGKLIGTERFIMEQR